MIAPGRFRMWHPNQKEVMNPVTSEPELSYYSVNDQSIPTDQNLYISIDPGPHTGWVVATKNLTFFLYGESTLPDMVPHSLNGLLQRMTSYHRLNTTIILEDFTLTNKPKDTKQAKITLRQIGAFQHVATRFGIETVMQIANVRTLTSTKILKQHSMWPVAQTHAQSAARHLGAYLITEGVLKPV
jgi:hypothetical protein